MPVAAIWVSDLVASIEVLQPANDSTLDAIADLLGIKRVAGPSPSLSYKPSHPQQTTPPPGGADSNSRPSPSASGRLPFTVQELPPIIPEEAPVQTWGNVEPVKLQASIPGVPPKPVPLFSPLAARFIAQELVASSRFGPHPDLDRLLDALARCEIPQPVPLQERRTLALGVQVLVDDGEGMEPFAGDQQEMVDLVRRLVGEALVEVRQIYEVPNPADPSTRGSRHHPVCPCWR